MLALWMSIKTKKLIKTTYWHNFMLSISPIGCDVSIFFPLHRNRVLNQVDGNTNSLQEKSDIQDPYSFFDKSQISGKNFQTLRWKEMHKNNSLTHITNYTKISRNHLTPSVFTLYSNTTGYINRLCPVPISSTS